MPTREDYDHLNLLAILHYVLGGLMAVVGTFPIVHFAIGVAIITGNMPMGPQQGAPPPEFFGWIFAVVGGLGLLIGWTMAGMIFLAGRCLATYQWRIYCIVVAALSCAFFPFGTALGVFTIIVLCRPGVVALFDATAAGKILPPPEMHQ